MYKPLHVTFKSKGKSGRVWTATFDLGSAEENALHALEVAWKQNAVILD